MCIEKCGSFELSRCQHQVDEKVRHRANDTGHSQSLRAAGNLASSNRGRKILALATTFAAFSTVLAPGADARPPDHPGEQQPEPSSTPSEPDKKSGHDERQEAERAANAAAAEANAAQQAAANQAANAATAAANAAAAEANATQQAAANQAAAREAEATRRATAGKANAIQRVRDLNTPQPPPATTTPTASPTAAQVAAANQAANAAAAEANAAQQAGANRAATLNQTDTKSGAEEAQAAAERTAAQNEAAERRAAALAESDAQGDLPGQVTFEEMFPNADGNEKAQAQAALDQAEAAGNLAEHKRLVDEYNRAIAAGNPALPERPVAPVKPTYDRGTVQGNSRTNSTVILGGGQPIQTRDVGYWSELDKYKADLAAHEKAVAEYERQVAQQTQQAPQILHQEQPAVPSTSEEFREQTDQYYEDLEQWKQDTADYNRQHGLADASDGDSDESWGVNPRGKTVEIPASYKPLTTAGATERSIPAGFDLSSFLGSDSGTSPDPTEYWDSVGTPEPTGGDEAARLESQARAAVANAVANAATKPIDGTNLDKVTVDANIQLDKMRNIEDRASHGWGILADQPCIDSDGDGWGWIEATRSSCQMAPSADRYLLGRADDTSDSGDSDSVEASCVDTDGDGWGWTGTVSCEM